MTGVSYLTAIQWQVAPLRPPHLAAINPFEGFSDWYREFAYHGGIPETSFLPRAAANLQYSTTRTEDTAGQRARASAVRCVLGEQGDAISKRSRCRRTSWRAGPIRACIRAARSRRTSACARSRSGSKCTGARSGTITTSRRASRSSGSSSITSSRSPGGACPHGRRCRSRCASAHTWARCAPRRIGLWLARNSEKTVSGRRARATPG